MSKKMSEKSYDQKVEKQDEKSEEINDNAILKKSADYERGSKNYIHELTMQTMVNRDVIRKIKERQQIVGLGVREMSYHQLQEITRELWDITQTREFSMDMNSCYPYELQKSFNEFVDQTRQYLEKHPPLSSPFQDENPHEKAVEQPEKQEDTKEIHMLPVFMEKQHPLWNYNHFNRRKAIHAYPPDSEYHISSSYSHSSLEKGGIWKKERSGGFQDTLFGELEEEF